MRIRMGILAVALAVSLAGCSDDPDSDEPSGDASTSPSSTTSETPDNDVTVGSLDCPGFADTAEKIVEAQTELYAPGGGDAAAIDDLVAELEALKDGAPTDIQDALTELGDGFERAAELLDDGTQETQAELLELGPKLAEAGKTVTDYVAEQCG